MTAPTSCEHTPRCPCADVRESYERQLFTAMNDRNRLRAVLEEWRDATRDLRKWINDKSTPRDDAKTDAMYARVEAAEKAAHNALVPRTR